MGDNVFTVLMQIEDGAGGWVDVGVPELTTGAQPGDKAREVGLDWAHQNIRMDLPGPSWRLLVWPGVQSGPDPDTADGLVLTADLESAAGRSAHVHRGGKARHRTRLKAGEFPVVNKVRASADLMGRRILVTADASNTQFPDLDAQWYPAHRPEGAVAVFVSGFGEPVRIGNGSEVIRIVTPLGSMAGLPAGCAVIPAEQFDQVARN